MTAIPIVISNEAAVQPIQCRRGWNLPFQLALYEDEDRTTPFDLTGWTVRLAVKLQERNVEFVVDYASDDVSPFITVSGEDNNVIEVDIPGATTATFDWTTGYVAMEINNTPDAHGLFIGTWTNLGDIASDPVGP